MFFKLKQKYKPSELAKLLEEVDKKLDEPEAPPAPAGLVIEGTVITKGTTINNGATIRVYILNPDGFARQESQKYIAYVNDDPYTYYSVVNNSTGSYGGVWYGLWDSMNSSQPPLYEGVQAAPGGYYEFTATMPGTVTGTNIDTANAIMTVINN